MIDPSGACVLCDDPFGVVSRTSRVLHVAEPYVRNCISAGLTGAAYGALTGPQDAAVGAAVGCGEEVVATAADRHLGPKAGLAVRAATGLYGAHDAATKVARKYGWVLRRFFP